jgi:hypothetical protein
MPPRFPKEVKIYRDPLYPGPYIKRTDWICDYCGCFGAVAHAPGEGLLEIVRLATKDHDRKCPRDMLIRKVYYRDDRGRVQEAMRRHHGLESMRLARPRSSGDPLRPAPARLTRESRHPDLLLGDVPDGAAD